MNMHKAGETEAERDGKTARQGKANEEQSNNTNARLKQKTKNAKGDVTKELAKYFTPKAKRRSYACI